MRRWNGWGDESTSYHVPPPAVTFLEGAMGPGRTLPDASFEEALHAAGKTSLPSAAFVSADPTVRLRHARGQSLPDWVAMRSGRIGAVPDGVAFPESDPDVRKLFEYARSAGARIIPYGGGTSVVGGVNPRPQDRPVLTVDLSRLNRLSDLDTVSGLATFGAGANGPEIERALAGHGYTLGHYPQSWELSTLGGWVVTRSSGQQSYYYGRIEKLFAGGHVESPAGSLDLPVFPASAAGPDLREFILGSEGRFGIVTRATVRVRKIAGVERFYGVFFRNWQSGVNAVREIAQCGVPVSMLRLSDPDETEATLNLAGKEFLTGCLRNGLSALGYRGGRCLLILGVTGDRMAASYAYDAAMALAGRHKGLVAGQAIGKAWRKGRFLNPYLRNTLWELGYAADTLETAVPWSSVSTAATAIKGAIRKAVEKFNERVLVFAHLSHVYPDGASIYATYLWRRASDPDEVLAAWRAMKTAASSEIRANGGTISHQHGVGVDHAPYLRAEKGKAGMQMLEAVRSALDPTRILNPGKLLVD